MLKPIVVVMAGGRGERLWPRSRRNYPKQLLNLTGEGSLLQLAISHVKQLTTLERIMVVVGMDYVSEAAVQLPEIPVENIIAEPASRNTAAAVAVAASYIQKRFLNENPVLMIIPSDTLFLKVNELVKALQAAFEYATTTGTGVILGKQATAPTTCYGYILPGEELATQAGMKLYQVAEYREKPDYASAVKLLEDSNCLWNGGIFVWRMDTLWTAFKRILPEFEMAFHELLPFLDTESEGEALRQVYHHLPALSFDQSILEQTKELVVIPAEYDWQDLGSWQAVADYFELDQAGNAVQGENVALDTQNCIIYSKQQLVATLGVQDLIIVAVEDVILICDQARAQEVKHLVAKLCADGRKRWL